MQTAAESEKAPKPSVPPPSPRKPADLRPYSNEKTLFVIMAVISALAWVALTVSTFGIIWIIMGVLYILGLVAFSYFISYVRGNGVQITANQFPDLHARFEACCKTIGMTKQPEFYLMTGNGALNAFATRFLRRYYVVLYSEVVDALDDDPDALNFYIGHELGHIAQKHLVHHWWLVFARWIPLLGAAYSRAREYTCDQYGLLCTNNKGSAARALSVLAAGGRRWKTINTNAYIAQTSQTSGFWMSINELTADYPWLCKRVARVEHEADTRFPRRNFFAWVISATIPNTGFGLIGAVVVYLYLGMFLVPIGIAAYSSYAATAKVAAARAEHAETRNQLTKAYDIGMSAATLVGDTYVKTELLPDSLETIGFKNTDPALVKEVTFDSDNGSISLALNPPLDGTELSLVPSLDDDGKIIWTCSASGNLPSAALPDSCTSSDDETDDEEEAGVPTPSITDKLLKMFI